ncbi:CRISPR-associated endonuclease/helicase Cas3 [Rubripirellula lacrimiformis]|uniref:CRISPR-associated endonuclease/helicase Cas3 n=2 Tax=Rubripirellula lacrimiformis TaxID=1930273 RepID=A0A517NFE8_9BACT|nr:CRISPR-associated endonuclease/helicase Cas3 [Rubripirellula lacrimiformis]
MQSWFNELTGHDSPRPWQLDLLQQNQCRSKLLRIPTGMGKTEGVLSAWLYHRIVRKDESWPRRLVWCLPMRVLVEQTVAVAEAIAKRVKNGPSVGVLMGGEDMEEWFLQPEQPWILIGTQDMLLSRALNRGYASGRARWPMEFGLLNQDSLWVMDEIQLMDVGLATSAQLQSYRDQDAGKSLRPCYTWWMSATLQPDWLHSVDSASSFDQWATTPCVVPPEDRHGGLWETSKSISTDAIASTDSRVFAERVLVEHEQTEPSEFGRVTLVVCNTVDRACDTFDALKKESPETEVHLVHGRFRPWERKPWRDKFLSRSACTPDADRIIVATQVVEAGVDISSGCLVTELAPWPNLVQRFGRCARYGDAGRVIVIDRGQDEKSSPPYSADSLTSAWAAVQSLSDVGIKRLEEYEEQLEDDARALLYPYEPAHLLMRNEFDELFDTTPDLTGADLDISRFIRSGEERDVKVFWIQIAKAKTPDQKRQPQRAELCSVPFMKSRDWLCGKETQTNRKPGLRGGMLAWVWDWLDGEWVVARRESLLPGRIVCVAASAGGYTTVQGFTPNASDAVPVVEHNGTELDAVDEADNEHDGEALSFSEWKTIACHSDEVIEAVARMAEQLQFPPNLTRILKLAARWHDVGKSHPAFQGAIVDATDESRPVRCDLAKGPPSAWVQPPGTYRMTDDGNRREYRRSFRHELASAMALFTVAKIYQPDHPGLLGPWREIFKEMGQSLECLPTRENPPDEIQAVLDCTSEEFDLLVYLVASHHGKVRVSLHASPADQDFHARANDDRGLPIRGVRNGDILPSITISVGGQQLPELPLSLAPAAMGLSHETGASWRERCQSLLTTHGPARLAMLEAILRAADVEASRLNAEDAAIMDEVTV